MSPTSRLLGPAAVLLALGCSSSPPASVTTPPSQCTDAPATCPAQVPTYADVSPLLARDCVPCHAANTGGKDESSYAAIAGQAAALRGQVGTCQMPPQGSPQLTADERAMLLTWLFCGTPP